MISDLLYSINYNFARPDGHPAIVHGSQAMSSRFQESRGGNPTARSGTAHAPAAHDADALADPRRRRLLGRGLLALLAQMLLPLVPRNARPGLPSNEAAPAALRVLTSRPLNAETPAHLLDPDVTPRSLFFIRNNGLPPAQTDDTARAWTLRVDGESCQRPADFSLDALRAGFPEHSLEMVIECGGNGRHEFNPATPGNQWTVGAVGCARWTGVRLRDVLAHCGIAEDAVYLAYEGADRHLSGQPDKRPISRGVPIAKALEEDCLIAWAMNGKPLPRQHGYPLRLVIGGWPGSVSGKWLTRLLVRDRVHDGAKMGGQSYRLPCEPVAPGSDVPDERMCIIGAMPIKSLITAPASGLSHPGGQPLPVRGHAWAGDRDVAAVHVSTDYGANWMPAELLPPPNRHAWCRWSITLPAFPTPGYYEVWARATDAAGRSQPMVLPGWNPKGYLNNACHRIAVQVI